MKNFVQISVLSIILTLLGSTLALSYYDAPSPDAFHFKAQTSLNASAVSARVSLGSTVASSPASTTALVQNLGTTTAYVILGASNVVATTTTGFPVQSTQSVRLAIMSATHLAAITTASSSVLAISTGY